MHHVQPRVVSITQSTEQGSLYTPDEIAALAEVAHANGMRLHLDGARIANAAAALGGDVRSFTVDAGVDVLTFGGTKNGMVYGEAVVFLDPELGRAAPFVRKQAGPAPVEDALRGRPVRGPAGRRPVAAQRRPRQRHGPAAGQAGRRRARGRRSPARPRSTRCSPPCRPRALAALQAWSHFYVWDEATTEVRWMTSFDTTPDDVERFAAGVASLVDEHARL